MQNWNLWLRPFLGLLVCIEAFLDLVLIHITESFDFLLIGWAKRSVQLSALFTSVPYGEALPLAKNSLLQEVYSQLPNSLSVNREAREV